MPLCQGRPNVACPKAARGRAVTSCQGDLWLCRECDEFRFPTCDASSKVTKSKSRPNARKASQSSSLNPVCSQDTNTNSSNQCESKSAVKNKNSRIHSVNSNTSTNACNSSDDECHSATADEICISCFQNISDDKRVQCSTCSQKLHLSCSGVPIEAQEFLIVYANTVGYVCSDCRQSMHRSFSQFQTAISVLTDELAILKAEIAQTKKSLQPEMYYSTAGISRSVSGPKDDICTDNMTTTAVKTTGLQNTANSALVSSGEIVSIVERTVRDSARRKKNVIVSGLPENSNVDDKDSFLNVCTEHLSIKPYISSEDCVRIGKVNLNKPRRLLVHLKSEHMAAEVLTSAKKLRTCDDSYVASTVFINPDLSPSEAKLAFERRERRRQNKAKNE